MRGLGVLFGVGILLIGFIAGSETDQEALQTVSNDISASLTPKPPAPYASSSEPQMPPEQGTNGNQNIKGHRPPQILKKSSPYLFNLNPDGNGVMQGGLQIVFGDDTSIRALNKTCDDPRFIGPDTIQDLFVTDMFHDASDCRNLISAGRIQFKNGAPNAIEVISISIDAVDFGIDGGEWHNDEICEDPRFIGRGMGPTQTPDKAFADATDCVAAFSAGTVHMKAGSD